MVRSVFHLEHGPEILGEHFTLTQSSRVVQSCSHSSIGCYCVYLDGLGHTRQASLWSKGRERQIKSEACRGWHAGLSTSANSGAKPIRGIPDLIRGDIPRLS